MVAEDESGIRVDRWFKRHHPALTHGLLEKPSRIGAASGSTARRAKSSDRLSTGQIIRLPPQIQTIHRAVDKQSTDSQTAHSQPSEQERIFAEGLVIHKDSAVLVLNKPSGLATQGGSGITRHVDGLLEFLTFGKKQKPRLVHRLDRDTSGVLVVARTVLCGCGVSKIAGAARCAKNLLGAGERRAEEEPRHNQGSAREGKRSRRAWPRRENGRARSG